MSDLELGRFNAHEGRGLVREAVEYRYPSEMYERRIQKAPLASAAQLFPHFELVQVKHVLIITGFFVLHDNAGQARALHQVPHEVSSI